MIGIVGITSAEAPCLEINDEDGSGHIHVRRSTTTAVHFEDQYNEIINITKLY